MICVSLCILQVGCGNIATNSQTTASPTPPTVPIATDSPTDEQLFMQILINEFTFNVKLADNETARQFAKKLPLSTNMSDLNSNEKFFYMSENLPSNAQSVRKIFSGDIMLYGSNCLVLFYENFSTNYSYTKIGSIEDVSNLKTAVGSGDIIVTFSLQK